MSIPFDPGDAGYGELLQLFQEELSSIQFPGADATVLEEAQNWVNTCRDDVERCEAALEQARASLAEAHEVRWRKGQRALSYARIYAEDDAELSARLSSINLMRHRLASATAQGEPSMFAIEPAANSRTPSAPRRRGRSSRAEPSAPLLVPAVASSSASADSLGAMTHAPNVAVRETPNTGRIIHKAETSSTAADEGTWADLAAVV